MHGFENNNVHNHSPEEVRELYDVIDKSKKDARNAYIAVGSIMILSLTVVFSNTFSSTSEPEGTNPTAALEQTILLAEIRDQNSYLRNELTSRQDDFRRERINLESQLNSKDQNIDALEDRVAELTQKLQVIETSSNQPQEKNSSEKFEAEILLLTEQLDETVTENEKISTELSNLRIEIEKIANNAADTSTELLEAKMEQRTIAVEKNNVSQNETSNAKETQAPVLTEKQVLFRDRFRTFNLITNELHTEVLQLSLNTQNEIPTFTLDKLERFKKNTGWLISTDIDRAYRESLRDLWDLTEVLETIDALSNDQGYLAAEINLSDISSKITDLQDRPYETKLLLASITIFLAGVEVTPASRKTATYPKRAQQRGISGEVNIEFAIDRFGSVAGETINVTAGPRLLEEASIETLKQTRYTVNPVPDYILRNVSREILTSIRLFGLNRVFRYKLAN